MLHSVAGSKIDIKTGSEWVEIAEPSGLGSLGASYGVQDVTGVGNEVDGVRMRQYLKTIAEPGQMQMLFGLVASDPGQLALWAAFRSLDPSDFRIRFPDSTTARYWSGLVIAVGETFDEANQVICLSATIQNTTLITRGEA